MSYPVALPDRRILRRNKCALTCTLHLSPTKAMEAQLEQLDTLGARVRLPARESVSIGDVVLVLGDGSEIFGSLSWRRGDVIGIRRHARNSERAAAMGRPLAA